MQLPRRCTEARKSGSPPTWEAGKDPKQPSPTREQDAQSPRERTTREQGPSRRLPEPMPLACIGVATDSVILVSQPHNKDDVKRRGGVIEEFGHDGLHTYRTEGG